MRIAILSDIHSNLSALEAVVDSFGSVDAVWHLGDVVGYGPEPVPVIERLRELRAIGVKGNHDDAALGGESAQLFTPDAAAAIAWTRRQLGSEEYFLARLPEVLVPDGFDFTLVHGSPRQPIWEYLDRPGLAAENMRGFSTSHCLVGHTHVPVIFLDRKGRAEMLTVEPGLDFRLKRGRAILNPGSVGQPRDGDPRASYMVLDTEAGVARWERVAYDIEATASAMEAAGLPARLARRLSFGL